MRVKEDGTDQILQSQSQFCVPLRCEAALYNTRKQQGRGANHCAGFCPNMALVEEPVALKFWGDLQMMGSMQIQTACTNGCGTYLQARKVGQFWSAQRWLANQPVVCAIISLCLILKIVSREASWMYNSMPILQQGIYLWKVRVSERQGR